MDNKQFLQRAIEKAKESVVQGGFPASAICTKSVLAQLVLLSTGPWT